MLTTASTAFAQRLRQHRLASGLTQEALAERAGLSADGVQKIDRGGTHPHRDTIQRLVTALGLRGDDAAAFRVAAPAPRRHPHPAPSFSEDRPRRNLPTSLTSFVGREHLVAEVRRLLTSNRLVTLTGAGGGGKTRLALETAHQVLPQYRDGVVLVELAPLVESALVPQAVAAAIGVREQPGEPLLTTLQSALRSSRLLLLLDNCPRHDGTRTRRRPSRRTVRGATCPRP